MKYNPDIKHRRSIRLKEYDYSQAGAYFVTICTQSRECYLGSIVDGALKMTSAGNIAGSCLMIIPSHFKYVELDVFVVMPNHIHAIIVINNNNNRRGVACNAPTEILISRPEGWNCEGKIKEDKCEHYFFL